MKSAEDLCPATAPGQGGRPRHTARILSLQSLYQLDIQKLPPEADPGPALEPLVAEAGVSADTAAYALRLASGTWSNCAKYDRMIRSVSDHWEVGRMAVVDRNILRMALYELLEEPDVPVRVILDEAIEIGREFGSEETPQFINGVLDAIWKQHEACRIARPQTDPGGRSAGAAHEECGPAAAS